MEKIISEQLSELKNLFFTVWIFFNLYKKLDTLKKNCDDGDCRYG